MIAPAGPQRFESRNGRAGRDDSSVRFALFLLVASSLFAQNAAHGEATWAKTTGLPIQTIHRLWRSTSHFANESDDDSQIVLLDAEGLAARNQLLMVTAAGVPTCFTVTVFSKAAGNLKLWSESSTPDGNGFCEAVGIEPEVTVQNGKILVKAPVGMHSEDASHADVAEYTYVWTGHTYRFGHQGLTLQYVPPSERPR